jgi:hypothetical protein
MSAQLITEPLVRCPLCSNDLPVSSFGVCRSRKSGRNLYCKECIRNKVNAARLKLKDYKAAKKRRKQDRYWNPQTNTPATVQYRKRDERTPVEKVRDAIRSGYQTQREIRQQTKLAKDVIGEALTVLLLWNREIKSVLAGSSRRYFFVEQNDPITVQRKPAVLGSFSSLYELGPGRKSAAG